MRPGTITSLFIAAAAALVLAACSSTSSRPQPTPLGPNPEKFSIKMVWSLGLSPVDFPLDVKVQDNSAAAADGKGEVVVFDVRTGQANWRASVAEALSAGVGFDGNRAAVVTRLHDLVALEGGKVIWRTRLNASSHTAPLVAGGRVFVLGADRAVSAFDGASGRRLWTQQRPGEPLVLRQAAGRPRWPRRAASMMWSVWLIWSARLSARATRCACALSKPRWAVPTQPAAR